MQQIAGIEYIKKARHTRQDTSSEHKGAEIQEGREQILLGKHQILFLNLGLEIER
jgi:hypothetical protein